MSDRIIKINGEPPRFRRTSVFVHDVIGLSQDMDSCDLVIKRYPKLTLSDLRAAYAYFKENKEEIFQAIEDEVPFGVD